MPHPQVHDVAPQLGPCSARAAAELSAAPVRIETTRTDTKTEDVWKQSTAELPSEELAPPLRHLAVVLAERAARQRAETAEREARRRAEAEAFAPADFAEFAKHHGVTVSLEESTELVEKGLPPEIDTEFHAWRSHRWLRRSMASA